MLGLVRKATGDDAAAYALWREALEIFSDIGVPDAREVGALLDGIR